MVCPTLVFKTFSYHLACFVPNYCCGHHRVIGSWLLRNGNHLLFITLSPLIFLHFSCFPFFLFLFSLCFFSLLLFQFIPTSLFIIYICLSHTRVTFPTFINVVLLPTKFPWGPLLAPRHVSACAPLHFSYPVIPKASSTNHSYQGCVKRILGINKINHHYHKPRCISMNTFTPGPRLLSLTTLVSTELFHPPPLSFSLSLSLFLNRRPTKPTPSELKTKKTH